MTKGKFRPVLFAVVMIMHTMAFYALWYVIQNFTLTPFHPGFSVSAWWWFLGLYTARSIGVSLGSHRLFTHGAFQCHFATQVVLAFLAGLSAEGPLRKWVTDHFQHHLDTEGVWDPHTPFKYKGVKGFLWAHVLWLFFEIQRPESMRNFKDNRNARIYKWDIYVHPIAVLSGFLFPWYFAGFEGLLLAGFAGVVFHWHVTWCVNSVCHLFGSVDKRFRKTSDNSKNNWQLSIISYIGEAWHNYHHQKADCAFLGWKWYHPDLGKWILCVGEVFGVFWQIKRPPQVQE